jgi:hypothetical protein
VLRFVFVCNVFWVEFQLESSFSPMGDQPQAIKTLVDGVNAGEKFQTALFGKNAFISLYSCAARVLLGAIIKLARLVCLITFALALALTARVAEGLTF